MNIKPSPSVSFPVFVCGDGHFVIGVEWCDHVEGLDGRRRRSTSSHPTKLQWTLCFHSYHDQIWSYLCMLILPLSVLGRWIGKGSSSWFVGAKSNCLFFFSFFYWYPVNNFCNRTQTFDDKRFEFHDFGIYMTCKMRWSWSWWFE